MQRELTTFSWHVFICLSAVSSPPRNLTVHPVSSTALQLSWQPPEEIPGMLVNYIIMFIGGGSMNTSILPPDKYVHEKSTCIRVLQQL